MVASFSWREMDPDKLNSDGMRLLRQYLEYAEGAAIASARMRAVFPRSILSRPMSATRFATRD